jgi:predicted Ser/Thr protein kinase
MARAGSTETEFAETVMGAMPSKGGVAPEPIVVGGARFVASRVIGEGGMGRVHEALDRQFSRPVALKELRGDRVSGAARERFATEALVTGNLEHPGVPPVYERGLLADGSPYYAMRLVRGRTLQDAIEQARDLPERLRLVGVVGKIAHTLAFAHERGVVHRDLKPENIVLGKHGEAVVLDWGIAKVRGMPSLDASTVSGGLSGSTGSQTGYGSVMGTPAYMAPEQAKGEIDRIDERTDVFALGAILYQILTGRPPYDGKLVTDVIAKAKEATFAPIASIEKKAPAVLVAIANKALSRAPEDRYQSAVDLADALENAEADALAGRGTSAVQWVVGGLIAFMTFVSVAGLALLWINLSFRDMGVGGYGVVFATVVGGALALIEIATRGRHRLGPLVLAVALVDLCIGIATTAADFDAVARGALKAIDDEHHVRLVWAEGSHEAIAALAAAAQGAAVLLLLWGVGSWVARKPAGKGSR